MYKQALRSKVRFQTSKGLLNIEQLWELTPTELDNLAVALETEYKASGKKSFLVTKSKKDKELKLKFDIVLDILTTKVEEQTISQQASATKEHNQKIMGLIAKKQEGELEGKSIEELEKLLK